MLKDVLIFLKLPSIITDWQENMRATMISTMCPSGLYIIMTAVVEAQRLATLQV